MSLGTMYFMLLFVIITFTQLAFTTFAPCFEMLFSASGARKTKHHEDVLGTRVPNFIILSKAE